LNALGDLEPETAVRLTENGEERVGVDQVRPGDVIAVRPGDRIPVDGNVISGQTSVDETAITGESAPAVKATDASVYAGTMNIDGYVEVCASGRASETLLSRVIQMVDGAEERKSPSEQFVRRFARTYTLIVVGLAAGVILFPPLVMSESIGLWFTRVLAVLVIACPCALIFSTPVAVINAITSGSRNGVLIKGGDHLEAMADVRTVAFDKTGTLTAGEFDVATVLSADGDEDWMLEVAAVLESHSSHPIARSIVRHANGRRLPEVTEFESTVGLGVQGQIDGQTYRVGRPEFMDEDLMGSAAHLSKEIDGTAIVVASEDRVVGAIELADSVRPGAAEALAALRREGIEHIAVLTGDRAGPAHRVAEALGVDSVHAQLLPGDKLEAIAKLESSGGHAAMVGDGINDAPALTAARVGVAMGAGGSDVALETADIALLTDDLSKMPYLVRLARHSRRVIRQNVIASIGVKLLLVAGAATGVVSLAAAIVVGDIGMSLAVTANALRLARCR